MVNVSLNVPSGLVLPSSVLQSDEFAVLAAFVAINTVMFAALAIAKILSKVHPTDLLRGRNRRVETRSIHPDGPTSRAAVDLSGRGVRAFYSSSSTTIEVNPGEHAPH